MNVSNNTRCFWVTGLSGAGKTTMINLLANHLKSKGIPVLKLDGDELRSIFGFSSFSNEERYAIGLKYSSLCNFIVSQNITVVIGVMGLFHKLHDWNRKNIKNYTEIFLDTPIDELIRRDEKGLYKRALNGEMENVAGINMTAELPINPDIKISWKKGKTQQETFEEIISQLYK
tara:strand:+ start:11978 stop:12499 length:522 start_codon:yes stop_codon:yes gene_type:complete